MASEPKGKLDAMTTEVVAVTASGAFVVNGPEDSPDGDLGIYIRWRDAEDNVARLGQRIFKATQVGDFKKSRSLQKLPAPRGALSYPRRSREELEGRFLGLMANLDPKR
jgi:hypothetical protein